MVQITPPHRFPIRTRRQEWKNRTLVGHPQYRKANLCFIFFWVNCQLPREQVQVQVVYSRLRENSDKTELNNSQQVCVFLCPLVICLFVCLLEWNPKKYIPPPFWREVNPLGVVTHKQRHKPRRAYQRQRHKPRTCQSMVVSVPQSWQFLHMYMNIYQWIYKLSTKTLTVLREDKWFNLPPWTFYFAASQLGYRPPRTCPFSFPFPRKINLALGPFNWPQMRARHIADNENK